MGLQIFQNAEFGSVRSTMIGGEPFLVGKDVAEILGYSNTRKALLDHVDEDDKMDGVTIRDSIGRDQTPVFINESGLYSLIQQASCIKEIQEMGDIRSSSCHQKTNLRCQVPMWST